MTVINYLWSEDNYLEEYDESGNPIISYTSEPSAFGSLISQNKGAVTNYFQFDVLGSTRQLTDSNENITDTYLFDAWGNETLRTGTSDVYFRYVGELGYYFDSEVESYYVRRRSYSPATSNWLSVDPIQYAIEFQGFFSSYHYVSNSPINRYDPTGLIELKYTLPGPCREVPQAQGQRGQKRTPFDFDQFGNDVKDTLNAAKKQKRHPEQWLIGFIQQVKIDISYSGGVSNNLTRQCCIKKGGAGCDCQTCSMNYNFEFLETIKAGGRGDRHPTTTQSKVLNLLGTNCPKCRTINLCCASYFKLTVTKTISPALIKRGKVAIQQKSAEVSCPGKPAFDVPKDKIKNAPSFPASKDTGAKPEDIFDYVFSRPTFKRAVYGVEFDHPKCGDVTKTVFGWHPKYGPQYEPIDIGDAAK